MSGIRWDAQESDGTVAGLLVYGSGAQDRLIVEIGPYGMYSPTLSTSWQVTVADADGKRLDGRNLVGNVARVMELAGAFAVRVLADQA